MVGIDGIPTAKSNRSEFWPILGQLKEEGLEQTFVIGQYSGPSKPDCVNEFLRRFVDETVSLVTDGLSYRGKY